MPEEGALLLDCQLDGNRGANGNGDLCGCQSASYLVAVALACKSRVLDACGSVNGRRFSDCRLFTRAIGLPQGVSFLA